MSLETEIVQAISSLCDIDTVIKELWQAGILDEDLAEIAIDPVLFPDSTNKAKAIMQTIKTRLTKGRYFCMNDFQLILRRRPKIEKISNRLEKKYCKCYYL